MNLAGIPLPDGGTDITIREHDRAYPTIPGKVSGIVYVDGRVTTVQCAVCLRTATGHKPFWPIVNRRWNHAPDDEGTRAPTPYKRCPDCRAAGLHPEPTLFDA